MKNDFKGTVPAGVTRRSPRQSVHLWSRALDEFRTATRIRLAAISVAGKFVVRGGSGIFYKLIDGQHFLDTWDGEPPVAAPFTHTSASNSAATFNVPFTPAIQIGSFNSFLRTPTSAISLVGVDPNLITPTTFNWNLETQYAITPSLVFEVGYVGDRTEHTEATLVQDVPVLASPSDPVNCGAPFGCVDDQSLRRTLRERLPVLGFRRRRLYRNGERGLFQL